MAVLCKIGGFTAVSSFGEGEKHGADMLSDLKFLKHKQKVENDIKLWETRIRAEEIEELLRSV